MTVISDKEKALLAASKRYTEILVSKDASPLKELVTSNVILHKDDTTFNQDVVGVDSLKKYLESYWEKYEFKHCPVTGAVDEKDNIAFSFSVDQDVKPKKGAFPDLPEDAHTPTNTYGIWKFLFDGEHKIKEVWYLRSLSVDEMHRKMTNAPDYKSFNIDSEVYEKPAFESSEERAKGMQRAAELYNKIWATGRAELADDIMTEDVENINLIFCKRMKGRQSFKDMINGYFEKGWEPKENHSCSAVTAGNKAFIHWSTMGRDKGASEDVNIFGLNMLTFNEKGVITTVLGLLQPPPSARKSMFKD